MRGIELERGGACVYQDNDEKIDPDNDFAHIDKRIQDLLGQYQKDFMGEVSADNLGARWGGYGSFLPVCQISPIPSHTRPQANSISRSPLNPKAEVHPNPSIQANEVVVMPRPGIPPLSGKATSALDNAVDIRSSREAYLKNQLKTVPAGDSDNNLPEVRLKVGTDKVKDNSAIYSGLGLDDSPSSSFGDSPSELDATLTCIQGLPEGSPSYVIGVMTSFPVPDDQLLSPLSKNLLSLTSKEISSEGSFPHSILKADQEPISSEGKMNLLKERKVKQINKDKVSELERGKCEDPTSTAGQCSKRMEASSVLKCKELNLENPAIAVDMPVDRKDISTTIHKDNVSNIPFSFSERIGQSVEVGTKLQKQAHARQGTSIEQANALASPVTSVEGKGNPLVFREMIQRNKNVNFVIRNDDELSQVVYTEQNSKKSTEQATKKKVEEEFEVEDSFSSRDAGMQHDRLTKENSDKSSKQERKMKSKVKTRPNVASQEVDAYHERTKDRSAEKFHNHRKASFIVEKIIEYKKNNGIEHSFQGMKDPDVATAEPLTGSSSEKQLPHFQVEAKLSERKVHPSSDGKKKAMKSQSGSQLTTTLPKVSFRVGSSAALSSQQAECGSEFLSLGDTQKELREEKDISNKDVAGKATPKKKDNDNNDVAGKATLKKDSSNHDVAGKATLKKKDNSNHDVPGKAILKEQEKVTASKDSVVGVARREKYASGSKLKDKSDDKQSHYPPNVGFNPRQDLTNISHVIEKPPASGILPTEIDPVVIQEDWVLCDKCQTWRLLPHNIKPGDLPKRWLCSMLTWLPGMNKCSFTEEETREALLALYQPPPLADGTQIQQQPYPTGVPPIVTADTQLTSITNPATGLDTVPGGGRRRPKEEVHANSKKDQLCTSESGNKQKLNQSRAGTGKPVVIGKKREGSKDTDVVRKKVKRDPQQYAADVDHVVPLATEIGNVSLDHDTFSTDISKDLYMGHSNIAQRYKEKTQKPADGNEDERKDVIVKKRKLKDRHVGPIGTETPSSQAPLVESSNDMMKVKRQRLNEPHFSEKESSTIRANDKNKGGRQYTFSCGGSSAKVGRREDRPSEQHRDRNMSHKAVDGKKSFGSGSEYKMPALVAATSSSSKVSSTCRVKVKSQPKCSPVGSISSSPLKVSRSDHDRSRNHASVPNGEQELPLVKKSLEERSAVPDFVPQHEEKTEGKSKRDTESEVQVCPVQEDAVKKMSALRHADEHRREMQVEFKPYESKPRETDFKEDYSSRQKLSSTDDSARSSNVLCLDKPKSEDVVRERRKPKQDQVGSSRAKPSSSAQELESEKADEHIVMHDSKGKLPKLPGFGHLVADDAGASSSVRKESSDRAARTALKEATDLKRSADRLKISGSGFSTQVFFQAALKYLKGASLLESGTTDVYSSTANLCQYCAHEFEKSNDMACAALAYKCMEVAYMCVVYGKDVAASRARSELQLAQTAPQAISVVESPSSSASDVDNVNNPTPNELVKSTQSSATQGNYVISAGNRLNFDRLLDFARDVNLAMDAARKSQAAFAAACVTLGEAGNGEGISSIKRVLDFSFHDVDGLLHLIRVAMEAFSVVD